MRVRFDRFTLDTARRQLTRGGESVHLSPKAFALLALLVERQPAAVSKQDLDDLVWPGTHVSSGSLTVAIAEVRSALGDRAQQPKYVRTIPRFGYAFCGTLAGREEPSTSGPPTFEIVWGPDRAALAPGPNVLGRGLDADIRFDSADVSRRHATLTLAGGRVTLQDLDSKNGTFVDGEPIDEPVRLCVGSVFELGPIRVRLRAMATGEETTTALKPPTG